MNSARDRRVLFIRPGPIGNTLAAVPALRALRKAWPEARVTLLVERLGEEALRGCPYVDEFLIYEKDGADSGPLGWLRAVWEIRKRELTHVVLSKRYFRMSFLAWLSGAPVRVGFAGYGYKISEAVNWQPNRPVIDTNLDLVAALGIPPAGRELEIWPDAGDKEQVAQFLREQGIMERQLCVAIHAGGVTRLRNGWPLERYAELAVAIEKQYAVQPIFVGARSDMENIKKIAVLTGKQYPNTASAGLNIRASAQLIGLCKFFIGADSGPSHIAQAVGTPGIIYYGPQEDRETNIKRWKPEGEMYIAAGPLKDGSHPDVRAMLGHVSELIHQMHQVGRWN